MEKVFDFNKIGVIDSELLDKIDSGMIPNIMHQDSIYHYTSINGLKEILGRGKMWFTHISYMNDRDEVVAGAEKLKKVGLVSCEEEYGKVIEEEAQRLMRKNHNAFVCCFSMKRDELAMWNYYTKDICNQGYNIGFGYKNLIISLLKRNPELHGAAFSFGKIDYCLEEETYVDKMYNHSLKVMEETIEALIKFFSNESNEKTHKNESTEFNLSVVKYYGNEPIFRQLPSLDVIYFMKRPCFSIEAEFRIVIKVSDEILQELKEKGKYKYRVSNGLLVPYLDLDFDITSITGVALSPTINSDLAERSINDYCKYCSIDVSNFEEGIKKSEVPVRF